MKNLNKKMLFFAIVISLITAYLSYSYLKSIQNEESKLEYINIIVASRDIPAREKITLDMIKKIKILKESHVVNSIQDQENIVGMYTKERILNGEVIPEERLMKEEEKDLSYKIPVGKRAISIFADEISGVADLIKPSDYVDIYVTIDEKKIEDKRNTTIYPQITKLVLQNVEVLAVSKELIRKDEDRAEIPNRYAVTLAVTPEDGEKLIFGEEVGRLKLALRPVKEEKTYDTPGALREDLVPEKGKLIISK